MCWWLIINETSKSLRGLDLFRYGTYSYTQLNLLTSLLWCAWCGYIMVSYCVLVLYLPIFFTVALLIPGQSLHGLTPRSLGDLIRCKLKRGILNLVLPVGTFRFFYEIAPGLMLRDLTNYLTRVMAWCRQVWLIAWKGNYMYCFLLDVITHSSHKSNGSLTHDDIIKWKFVALLASCAGNSRGALMFSLSWNSTNGCANNRNAGNFWRHRAHYDVTVM